MPARKTYMPSTDAGIAAMLVGFDTNATANSNALATKYVITTAELNRIRQARYVWQWFIDTLGVARDWPQSITAKRDGMFSLPAAPAVPVPGGPTLPASPMYVSLTSPGGTPPIAALLEPGFFTFFAGIVARVKDSQIYEVADGELLGIEGAEIPPPDPSVAPVLTGDLFHSGHPELSCKKGVFQGYTVWMTRPGQPKRQICFSTGRRCTVTEPLPAPGTAEIWVFEAQYRYKDAPFGQISQPLELTVRG